MGEIRLFEITTGYEDDPSIYVLADNLREALAKYKNDIVDIVNKENQTQAETTNVTLAPISASDVEDPVSICMLGDIEQVIL